MDRSPNSPPRRLVDTVEARCARCGAVAYREDHIAELQADDRYTHRRIVRGGFTQTTDADGNPVGPAIPKCFCQE